MYFRIVLGFVSTFLTSKYSFSSGVGYAMRPILLIMWTAFQSFILRHNNNNNYNTNNNLYTGSSLHNEWYSVRPCKFHAMDSAFQIMDSGFLTVELGFGLKSPRFWILQEKISGFWIPQAKISRILESGFPYMGWLICGIMEFFWDSLEVSIWYFHFG